MMPRTHFMIGALSVALLSFFFKISLFEVFLGGIIGSIIDLDHLYSYKKRHGTVNIAETVRVAVKHLEHQRTPYIHGWIGVLIFLILSGMVYYFAGMKFALIVLLPYLLHLVFDFLIYASDIMSTIYKFGHYLIPVTFDELIIDVFAFDLLLIAVLYFGIV